MGNRCHCNIISFGHMNLYLLLIPLGAVLTVGIESIIFNSEKLGRRKGGEQQHPIIITINYALGLCLSFIPFIISKVRSKRINKSNISPVDKVMNKYNINNEISKKKKLLWILLSSVLDFIAKVVYYYNWIDSEAYLTFWATNLILMSLLSYFLLKTKLYKHHYISIGSIAVLGIVSNIVWGYFTPAMIKKNYLGYIMYFLAESISYILYVLYKFFMIKKYIKSYAILFFQGLVELILGIIFLFIATKYINSFENYEEYFQNLNGKEIAFFITLMIIHFLTYLTIFIIIDIFTPFHIFLLNIISKVIISFFNTDIWRQKAEFSVYLIFLIISIFMILIYIEIIQLNFWGLSFMTKKSIEERAKLDAINSILNINNDENDNNNDKDNESSFKNNEPDSNMITVSGYTFELRNINKENLIQLLPSDNDE